MSRRVVMGMLRRMGGQLRIHRSAQQDEPCCQYHDSQSLRHSLHRSLPERRGFHRLLLLDSRDDVADHLFGQQSALDVFLHPALLIDKHTDG